MNIQRKQLEQKLIRAFERAHKENNLYAWAVLYETIETENYKGGYDVETYLDLDLLQTMVYQIYSDMQKEAAYSGVKH